MGINDPKNPVRPLPGFLPANAAQSAPLSTPHSRASRYGLDGGNAFEEPAEVPLREYFRVVFKFRMIIAAATLIGAVLALIYGFTATPRYTAKTTMRISTYEPLLSTTKSEDTLEEKSKEANYLETQIEELKSYSLADKVLENDKIRNYFEQKLGVALTKSGADATRTSRSSEEEYKAPIEEIKSYIKSIDITPVRRTSLVALEATAEDAQMAALIAHHHATEYIDWVRGVRVEQQSRALLFLRRQADELRDKVADIEREMADYAETNAIVAVNKDENIVAQKMAQLNQLLTDVTGKKIEAQNLFRQSDSIVGDHSAGFDDVSTQNMRSDLARLESEYQEMNAKFMPGYPRMVQMRSQIEGLKKSIENQHAHIVAGLQAKATSLEDQEKRLQEELDQQKSQAFELSKKQVQYNSLNRDLTSSRELLENVLKQIKETGLSVESNTSNISIVDLPIVPQTASFPRKKLLLFGGIAVGALAGIAAAFVLNYLDNSIKTPEEVVAYLKLPNLGVVPSFELERLNDAPEAAAAKGPNPEGLVGKIESSTESAGAVIARIDSANGLPVVFLKNPRSLAAEAYRTIRTGILLSQAGEPPRTLLVTSAQSSEGKTTSSVNLSASLASSGARVVLVDADLRRPSVHRQFRLDSNLPGLVEVITGQRLVEDVMIRDLIKRITVIPAGRIPPNPAELLGSYEMLSLLEKLATQFDYVVVDSPPILPVTDSVVLSRFVDGVVLVVRGGSTPRKIVADAKNRLLAVGSRVIGTVLNDVDITGGDYYYYNRYYHSYYRREGESSRTDTGAVV